MIIQRRSNLVGSILVADPLHYRSAGVNPEHSRRQSAHREHSNTITQNGFCGKNVIIQILNFKMQRGNDLRNLRGESDRMSCLSTFCYCKVLSRRDSTSTPNTAPNGRLRGPVHRSRCRESAKNPSSRTASSSKEDTHVPKHRLRCATRQKLCHTSQRYASTQRGTIRPIR